MKILFQHFAKVSLGHSEEPQLNCGTKNVLLLKLQTVELQIR